MREETSFQFDGILPVQWVPPPQPVTYEQVIIVNWLEVEVDRKMEMPVLDNLSHWRNRDCWYWVKDHQEEYYVRYAQ